MNTYEHLNMELRDARMSIKVLKHTALRAQEECQRAIEQRDGLQRDLDRAYSQIENLVDHKEQLIQERDIALRSNSSLRKEIAEKAKTITALAKGINEANATMCKDADEIKRLKDELYQERNAYYALKARLHGVNYGIGPDAHNKLKALCASHGVDPFCHDGMGHPRPKPTWKATFVANNCTKGVVTFHRAPTIKELDQLQRTFEATSWSVILP